MALVPNPNFPVITQGSWSQLTLPDNAFTLDLKIAELAAAGKTDGVVDIPTPGTPESPAYVAYRNWIDTDAANDWIAFINSLNDPYLVSYTIVTP